jgi:Family of unknown function (DUF5670)
LRKTFFGDDVILRFENAGAVRPTLFLEVPVRVGLLLGIAILLAIVWVVSFLVFHIAGLLIHVLLLLAVIFLILQLFTGRRT